MNACPIALRPATQPSRLSAERDRYLFGLLGPMRGRLRASLARSLFVACVMTLSGAVDSSSAETSAGSQPAQHYAALDDSDAAPEPAPSSAPAPAPPTVVGPAPVASAPPVTAAGPSNAPAAYRGLIAREADRQGLAPAIAEAVMAVESGFNPDAIGNSGEIGLMQIMPATARMLGFLGSNAELAVPETNIRYGVTYLAQAWRLAGGDICTATMKYRAGHGETRFSHLSVGYCVAVRGKLAALGFPVSGQVPVATFGTPGGGGALGGGCRRRCLAGNQIGRVNLAALNAQLNTLVVQVRNGR
ncbi:Endo-type membrane-bound lytic murein transglycosylase A [Rhodopseudomonas palustris]|uniref:Possible transglycosylase n=2 Tax=Rhodopseudomonas palustris (strain ATCC BAA-98 / CGA009) TaxID=258594 RepID=Q6NA27_RHOPA|nr:transglycosylase [Rhodopseudomonas palustris]QQM02855.1 Endo-type membrane-bound lytic murein transglycosylase A [Rhodopseudomonas palustris]CAE26802.1 possible transglycosylase [Rhodopseudomonas palustris CGA009]